jgi:hypothetical protein
VDGLVVVNRQWAARGAPKLRASWTGPGIGPHGSDRSIKAGGAGRRVWHAAQGAGRKEIVLFGGALMQGACFAPGRMGVSMGSGMGMAWRCGAAVQRSAAERRVWQPVGVCVWV